MKMIKIKKLFLLKLKPILTLRTNFLAASSHEALLAHTNTVRLSALRIVDAAALVLAVVAPSIIGTWRLAKLSRPAGKTLADAIDVMTLAVITFALELAVFAVRTGFARMITRQTNVTRATFEFLEE
jgi:hypothetical protein